MNPDPLKKIEDERAWTDFGRQAALLYKGAREEGLDQAEALLVVTAFIRGMFSSQHDSESE